MKYIKMTFLVGLIAVSVIASGVVGSAIPEVTLDKVVNVTTGQKYSCNQEADQCIQKAVNEANSGDVIVVYNPEERVGIYGRKVDITKQLTLKAEDLSDKPIILGGYSGDFGEFYGIAVHGSDPFENPEEGAPDNVVINGFRVRHETPDSKGIWLAGTENSTVKNNVIYDGWEEGIYLNEADNNTIGPGNVVKYNRRGLEIIDSDKTTIKDSVFNYNFNAGVFLPKNNAPDYNGENGSITVNTIKNLTIEGSEFNENENKRVFGVRDLSLPLSYGLLSRAIIDGMTVTGSEFNSNNGTGMAFGPSEETSVNNLSIKDSSFNNNVYFEDDYNDGMEPVRGFGLRSSVDTSNMEVTNSTFNNNFSAGMYFGPPPIGPGIESEEASLNTIEDLTIKNSHFNSNGLTGGDGDPLGFEGFGFLSYSHINKMTVQDSTFDENTFAGMSIGNIGPSDSPETIPNVSNVSISGSSFTGNGAFGLFTSANVSGMEVSQTEVKGNAYGLFFFLRNLPEADSDPEINVQDISIHHSSISDNTKSLNEGGAPFNKAGLLNATGTTINAAINWWGSATGPSVDLNYWEEGSEEGSNFNPEYEGGGDKILGSVAFAPWLGKDPDADPETPGVQLISPFPIIVRTVGPEPTTQNGNTGYLDMGIWGASSVPQRGKVIVPHGNWKAKEPLGNNAELISEDGTTCHTCLEEVENSKLTIDGNAVTVGKLDGYTPRGFIIKDEVLVKAGTDASTAHLNWNDIRVNVENNGDGRLDAEYNWWGDLDPSDSVKGDVDYRPFLPEDPCSFTDYMKEHGLTDPREAVVNRMSEGETCSTDLPKQMIVNYRLKPRQAENLVDKHGCYDIREAMEKADDDFATFKEVLGVASI